MTFEEWAAPRSYYLKQMHDSDRYWSDRTQWTYDGYQAGQESLRKEMDEQCRIIGKSAERELALLALVERMRTLLSECEDLVDTATSYAIQCAIAEADKFLGKGEV